MYVSLHNHSFYSLLDGVPSPEALVQQAAYYEMPALALTDHNALYGAVRFNQAAATAGVKPIFGSEITLTNGGHLTLLAETDAGYKNLCRLITLARRDQTKGTAALPWQVLTEHSNGLIALSGCRRGEIARALLNLELDKATRLAERYAAIFGRRNFFLETQRHHEHGDLRIGEGLSVIARQVGLRQIVTSNVHYLSREQAPVHDIVTCIHYQVPLHKAGSLLRPNDRFYLRSPSEMMALFVDLPDALRATREVAERCQARLPIGPQAFPTPKLPEGWSPEAYLRHLCEEGIHRKCSGPKFKDYRATLERELTIIVAQSLVNYFLVIWALMQFARSRGIVCQGRGSAANSLVAYLLDITAIDPLSVGLVFERFLSHERVSPADIDIDFAEHRREEVIQHLYQAYGHEYAAMACTVSTFGARQAVRDVGKALGMPGELLDRICEQLDSHSSALNNSARMREVFGDLVDSPRWQQLTKYATAIDSFPRHLGIHVGGMVMSGPPLIEQIPVEPASVDDRYVVQWDKDSLEAANWVKLDVLSLRALAAIDDACDFIARRTGHRPDLHSLRFDDAAVYDMLGRGEVIGVFQLQSRVQESLIHKFKPRSLADLTIQTALIRPGPVQGNMVHPYLRRRANTERVTYLHPLLEPVLEETKGVILFQEQVLRVAEALAGFSLGEGELLRRALGHKRTDTQIELFRDRFMEGARAKGVPPAIAAKAFEQLKAFGGYSFSKAHAASFAVICYWSAWLRCYYPVEFFVGILRHQPMGFYPAHVIVSDAIRSGVKVLPVDLRYSEGEVVVEGDGIRMGLDYLEGFGQAELELITAEQQRRPFESLADLVKRTGLERRHAETLVLADAVDHWGERRQLFWDLAEAYRLARRPPELPLQIPDEQVTLPPMEPLTRLSMTFAKTGVAIEAHLTALRRDAFTKAGATPIGELWKIRAGQAVKVGGLVIAKQKPPTAKGVCFLALEDADGSLNVVVPPTVYEEYRQAIRVFVIVEGILQRDGAARAIHVVAKRIVAV